MNGEELYKLYTQAGREINNCGSDTWEQLDEPIREEWNRFAEFVAEAFK